MSQNPALPQGYYATSSPAPAPRPRLNGDERVDVCVIGGGFTGLTAALHLAQAGARVALLEAETAGFAASGRNGGQTHTGYRMSQARLEKWLGQGQARQRDEQSARGRGSCAKRKLAKLHQNSFE